MNLTGAWDGRFGYAHTYAPVMFQAVLLELGAGFTGTTWEIGDLGAGAGRRLDASVEGLRLGREVAFAKRYDGGGGRSYAVQYVGDLNEDGTEISGRWATSPTWSGWFVMARPRRERREAEVECKVAEPAGEGWRASA